MRKTWFMVASDSAEAFRWEPFLKQRDSTFWWLRRLPRNFKAAKVGDLILCYRSGNAKRGLVGLAVVEEELRDDGIRIKGLRLFAEGIPYRDFQSETVYRSTEAGRHRNRGTLFSVHDEFVKWVEMELESIGDLESASLLK